MKLSQRLQEYRKTAKMSQEDLAERLGVSRQSVSKWEQDLSFPETDKLIVLSEMMGVSIDSLLKDGDEKPRVPEAEPPVTKKRGWVALLAVALALAAGLGGFAAGRSQIPEETTATTEATESTEATVATEGTEPVAAEGFEATDLGELQSWFFDFGRQYRLDYMPQFASEEGAPLDSGEYLYWVFAINMDNWGEEKGIMSKEYVVSKASDYFDVEVTDHRSHHKQWTYDEATETYTAYPESLKEQSYYLLESVEVDGDTYTVNGTAYYTLTYLGSDEDDLYYRDRLLEGDLEGLSPSFRFSVTFTLRQFEPNGGNNNLGEPVFRGYSFEDLK